jgi:hypothetical protein
VLLSARVNTDHVTSNVTISITLRFCASFFIEILFSSFFQRRTSAGPEEIAQLLYILPILDENDEVSHQPESIVRNVPFLWCHDASFDWRRDGHVKHDKGRVHVTEELQ